MYHCAQLLYTTQQRTVLIIFSRILQTWQTVIITQMMSTGGKGEPMLQSTCEWLAQWQFYGRQPHCRPTLRSGKAYAYFYLAQLLEIPSNFGKKLRQHNATQPKGMPTLHLKITIYWRKNFLLEPTQWKGHKIVKAAVISSRDRQTCPVFQDNLDNPTPES